MVTGVGPTGSGVGAGASPPAAGRQRGGSCGAAGRGERQPSVRAFVGGCTPDPKTAHMMKNMEYNFNFTVSPTSKAHNGFPPTRCICGLFHYLCNARNKVKDVVPLPHSLTVTDVAWRGSGHLASLARGHDRGHTAVGHFSARRAAHATAAVQVAHNRRHTQKISAPPSPPPRPTSTPRLSSTTRVPKCVMLQGSLFLPPVCSIYS